MFHKHQFKFIFKIKIKKISIVDAMFEIVRDVETMFHLC